MEEIDDQGSSSLCMACLCVGRRLCMLTDEKIKRYYFDTLSEIPLCNMTQILPQVCWECDAMLKKVLAFREQVKDSYRILQTFTNENLEEFLLSDVSRPPRLRVHRIEAVAIGDPEETVKEELKEEANEANKRSPVVGHEVDRDEHAAICEVRQTRSSKKKKHQERAQAVLTTKTDTQMVTVHTHHSDENEVLCKTEVKVEWSDENILSEDAESYSDGETCEMSVSEEVNSRRSKNESVDRKQSNSEEGVKTESNSDMKVEEKYQKLERDLKAELKEVLGEERRSKSFKKRKKSIKKPLEKTNMQKKKQAVKMITLDLTYEEMLADRQRESTRASYLRGEHKCTSCLLAFDCSKSLSAHLAAKHSPDIGEYCCPICKTVVATVDTFTTHYKRHMRRYECNICGKRTTDKKCMQQHYLAAHGISLKNYICTLCGTVSDSIDTHRYHMDSHKARVQCKDCEKTFSHRGGLMTHRLSVHECKNRFPCNACDKVFRYKTSLKRHLEKHDSKEKSAAAGGDAYCGMCDIRFSSVCSLKRHLRNSLKHVTHDQLKFICDPCGRRFADKTKLRDHIEEKHLHRTFLCLICNKTSKNRVGLEQHIRNVHKGRPNNKICHHCGKGFPTKVQLESHIRTHTGERPYICEYCPTTFSQQSNLYKHHRQVHLNIKTKRYPACKKRKEDLPPPPPNQDFVPIIQYMPEAVFGM